MLNLSDIFTFVSTVGSAVASGFAARAAYLSASSARKAQDALDAAERRLLLREVTVTAGYVLVEVKRIHALVNEVKQALKGLAISSGTFGGSRMNIFLEIADNKIKDANNIAVDSKLFSDGAKNLEQSPIDEIDRILQRQSNALRTVQTLRDDLEREQSSLQAQFTQILDARRLQ